MPGLLEEIVRTGLLANGPVPTPPKYSGTAANLFPHETNFGVGLSQKYLFPVQRLGSTRPRTTRRGGETIWTTDVGVEERPGEPRPYSKGIGGWAGAYEGSTGKIHMYSQPTDRASLLVAPHEAGHRSFGVGYPDVSGRGWRVRDAMGFRARPEPGGRGVSPSARGGERPHGFDEHEMLYLQDWVLAKLRGDAEVMAFSQGNLNLIEMGKNTGVPPDKIKYDIKAALTPGNPQRELIEKWNDAANEKLKELKRPPISGYKDYINKAIGYSPKKGDSKTQGGTP